MKSQRSTTNAESDSILEQLEFDINVLDREPFPAKAAYLLVDSRQRIVEYDHSAAAILGLPSVGSLQLSDCAAIAPQQLERLTRAVDGQLAQPDDSEESCLRLELVRRDVTEAFCLTLHSCHSASGEREVAVKIEPILTSGSDLQRPPASASDSSIKVWSMNPSEMVFHALQPMDHVAAGDSQSGVPLDDWIERVCEDDKELFRQGFQNFLERESDSFHMRYRYRKDSGELKWISTIARRKHETEAQGEHPVVGLHRDEAEIPNAVDDLRLFSYLAKKVKLSIVVTDPHGCITWCNHAFTDLTGYTLPEIVNRTPGSVLQGPLTDADTVRYMRDRVRKGKAFHAELVNYKRNGAPYWVRIDANPLVDDAGKVIRYIAFQTDITESKKTQSAILRSEIKFRSLFDNSFDALLLVSPRDGVIIEANRAALSFFDNSRLVGQKLDEIFPLSQVFRIEQLNSMVDEGEGQRRETGEYISADGARRPVEMSVNRTPIGEAIALFVTLRDISEKRALEEQLRHAQRMEAVGRLAGGIAHDFNNLLAGLRGFSELLCNSRDLSKKDHVYATEVLKITDRASKLTSRLLSFSRGKSDQPVVANLNEIVGNLTPMLSRILKKDIQFTSKLDPSLPNVRVDPAQIEQVVMNLVMNGQEAISGYEGVVTLNTRTIELSGSEIFITGKPRPGRYATVSVRDNGHGIPPKVIEKIFEPFFTTKKGAGTGLGLSIVYGIIQSNGGHLMVESGVSLGTEFVFYFPAVAESVIAIEPTDHRARMPSVDLARSEVPTILIAEDQDQVREILELGLSQSGYKILVARDGREAIELAAAYPGHIDLLLTDSIMPRASGCQVIDAVRQRFPHLKVVMTSGLPQQESDDCRDLVIDAYVDKPFSIRKLLELIESLLGVPN